MGSLNIFDNLSSSQSGRAKQKRVKFLFITLIFFFSLIILVGLYFNQSSDNNPITDKITEGIEKQTNDKSPITIGAIKETTTGKLNEKQTLGNLEITLISATEDSYESFELVNETYEIVQTNYYKVYINVFNPSSDEKETFSSIRIEDNLGNKYETNTEILFDLRSSDFKEFGRDMVIYPRVIREGYIVFPEIDEKAKKLKLIFETEKGGKAVFEFEK